MSKSLFFSTDEYKIGAFLQNSKNSVLTYHFLTLGVHIFFSHLCKLRAGWVDLFVQIRKNVRKNGPPLIKLEHTCFTCYLLYTGRYPVIPCLLSVCFDDAMHGRYFIWTKGLEHFMWTKGLEQTLSAIAIGRWHRLDSTHNQYLISLFKWHTCIKFYTFHIIVNILSPMSTFPMPSS